MSYLGKMQKYAKQNPKRLLLLIVALLVLFMWLTRFNEEVVEAPVTLPVVTITSAATLDGLQSVSLVGTVRAFNEAVVTAEASGRVVSVNASLGQTIPAGFVIATLENASERAAVLQAEGAYEAALSAAEQSGVSLDEARTGLRNAQNNAISTFSTAYNTVNGIVRNNIDTFFANPDSRLPGLKIDGQGQAQFLNNERITYQNLLSTWLLETNALTPESDLSTALETANTRVERTIALLDVFITLFNANNQDNSYTESELLTFSTNFTNLRSNLESTSNQITNSKAALDNAFDAVRRAEIGATGSQSSAADAQVKQALGSLRAAQATLANTILRTPISGTVNSLSVRVGDFVGNQAVVARVANNNALEVITYVGDSELPAFTVGSTVTIDEQFYGTVTEVAPAVDPVTRKTEVRIAVESESIQNGETVTISTDYDVTGTSSNQPLFIPLSAVKFEIDNGFVFQVNNGRLTSVPVELGVIRGGSVQIVSGLTREDDFVLDARGLLPDTEVEVRTQ
jgi:RND family efflux transporter MFP subunit